MAKVPACLIWNRAVETQQTGISAGFQPSLHRLTTKNKRVELVKALVGEVQTGLTATTDFGNEAHTY